MADREAEQECAGAPRWTVETDDERDGVEFIPITAPGLIVCEVYGSADDLSLTEEDRARARLIAASPCLAEALRQLVGNAEAAAKYVRGENDIVASALFDTIEQARAALAKAGASQ